MARAEQRDKPWPLPMIALLRRHSFTLAFTAIVLAFFYLRSSDPGEVYQFSGATMGTTYRVQIVELPEGMDAGELTRQVGSMLQRLDRELFSTYATDSELSRFNSSAPGTQFRVSSELAEVVSLAQQISRLTDGAFDVTVGPLVNLWGFGPEGRPEDEPEQEDIAEALSRVGYEHLSVSTEPPILSKSAPVTVDLSGIAKGYAVDQVADYMDSAGFDSYFIEIGGELRIKGYKPGNRSWVPAIELPADGPPEVYNVFYAGGESIAVAGSGDYRNYFEQNGTRYSHEIDPATGRPVTHNLAAATVIDVSAARADALATAFMVLGPERSLALAREVNLATFLITRTGEGRFEDTFTEEFAGYLSRQE